MKGYVMSSYTDCIGCLHVRKVVADALAGQQELVLNFFAPPHTRFLFKTATDSNVISNLILQFEEVAQLFTFDTLMCLGCTRDEVAQRIAAVGNARVDFDSHYSGEDEIVFNRVSGASWDIFAKLNVNSTVAWGSPDYEDGSDFGDSRWVEEAGL
jgi:hypothetical protein